MSLQQFTDLHIDVDDNSMVTMDEPHSRVHRGDYSTVSNYNSSIGNNAVFTTLFIVGTHDLHLTLETQSIGSFKIEIVESPTVTVNGSALTISNLNRRSTYNTDTTVFNTPTFTVGAVVKTKNIVAGTTGATRVSTMSTTRQGVEHILKAGLKYVIRLTNLSGASQEMAIDTEFYEEITA